jgi:hypothetical protein
MPKPLKSLETPADHPNDGRKGGPGLKVENWAAPIAPLLTPASALALVAILEQASAKDTDGRRAPPISREFQVDLRPLQSETPLATEWRSIAAQWSDAPPPAQVLQRKIEILGEILKTHPQWIDGMWISASVTYDLASALQSPADETRVRALISTGQTKTEKCLQANPKHIICKQYLGAMLGKKASLDGIMESIKEARHIEEHWLAVTKQVENYSFGPKGSVQGSVRYALGMFYRLVPQSSMVSWLFKVKGDLDKSIALHRQALELDPPSPCKKLMLAASLLCKGGATFKSAEGQEAAGHIKDIESLSVLTNENKLCKEIAPRLQATPSLSCGLDLSRQSPISKD